MPHDIPWWRRPGVHLRHDAHRWIRHDAARFVRPGFDPADVFPTLGRQRDEARRRAEAAQAAEDAAFAAELEDWRRGQNALRVAIAEVKAELARGRALDAKYSPTQPRVPAGNPRGGQWTDRSGGQGTGQAAAQDGTPASLTQPMGNVEIGDVSGSSEVGDLFQIKPSDTRLGGVQLAGELPDSTDKDQRVPGAEAPKIPAEKPQTSAERTGFMRAAADWLARNTGLAGDIYAGQMNNVEWLADRRAIIQAGRDSPKTLEELQQGAGTRRPGYDDHHIVEQTAAERWGFTRSDTDNPSNVVNIPRLRHYEITGWYGTPNDAYGGLSPREYLSDKTWEERRQVGLDALVRFKVLKP